MYYILINYIVKNTITDNVHIIFGAINYKKKIMKLKSRTILNDLIFGILLKQLIIIKHFLKYTIYKLKQSCVSLG